CAVWDHSLSGYIF
nr:immunoglobulin light chain junction region [Macaca mulatta]MPO03936.1 immunoglobulin light chain junction region [Macaca mulatta]MPO08439.1 immunoglobulin light chain junction region [Macaca mulatta]MPO08683.1 immunoglobulin light chain junction region [Macaca mulatta]MPO08759.1 immunoglobulin light chain junction region [Macaca mulatta]